MKILRIWFVKPEKEGEDLVCVYWEYEKRGDKISDLFCTTDTVSKAGRIVLAMRARMNLDSKPPRPKIAGFRSVWAASQHKWQLVRSKTKKTKNLFTQKTKETKPRKKIRGESSSSGSLRDTDWYDKDARFRGPRGDTW